MVIDIILYIIGEEVEEEIDDKFKMIPAHYCVKCELDTIYELHKFPDALLTEPERKMWNIYQKTLKNSTFIDVICEPKVAQAICETLKRENLGIEEELLTECFRNTIEDENQVIKIKKKSLV